jgi:hypothetical protein
MSSDKAWDAFCDSMAEAHKALAACQLDVDAIAQETQGIVQRLVALADLEQCAAIMLLDVKLE